MYKKLKGEFNNNNIQINEKISNSLNKNNIEDKKDDEMFISLTIFFINEAEFRFA